MPIGDKVRAALEAKQAARDVETDIAEAPAPAPTVDIAAIVQAAVAAALAAGTQNSADLASAITQGMQQVKEPIPENKTTDEISDLNPLGDRLFSRSGLLKCRMYFGAIDDTDDQGVQRAWEIEDRDASLWEIFALNMLEPTEKVIKRLDKAPMKVKVEARKNQASGQLERMTIAFPLSVIGKKGENRNMVPDLTDVVYQLTGHDLRPESVGLDMLKALHAEHKAKRYVGPNALKVAA